MNFDFSEDQILIFETIRNFSKKKLNERIFEDDKNSSFPVDKWKACGEMGIIGLPIPEYFGGLGKDILTTAHGIKALASGCKDEGLILSICAHLCTFVIPLWIFGSKQQKEKYLPKAISGELIGGNGISEAAAGSDISSIQMRVEKKDNNCVINGAKIFVTNGPIADALVIYAKHPNGMRMADTTAFVIDKSNFQTGQHFEKMGLRTSPLCEILLNNVSVSEDSILGRERLGINVFNLSMLWERIITSAYNIGAMERQFDVVLDYTKVRSQFNTKLIHLQTLADKLVEMKIKIKLSNLLLYKTCWKFDNNIIDMSDASMLKLYVSESKVKNCQEAVHIFGAYGYIKESIVEKDLRDSIPATIYSGTSEIQKKIITERLERFYEK